MTTAAAPMQAATTDTPHFGSSQALEDLERFRTQWILLARVRLGRLLRRKVDPDDLVQETLPPALAAMYA